MSALISSTSPPAFQPTSSIRCDRFLAFAIAAADSKFTRSRRVSSAVASRRSPPAMALVTRGLHL